MMPMSAPSSRRPSAAPFSWRNLCYQGALLALLGGLLFYIAGNVQSNLQAKGIASGFDFLLQPAGFAIGEGVFPYTAGDAYWQAFLLGIENTLRVSGLAILASMLIGSLLGLGRLSNNLLVRGVCTAYVEIFRNIPLLLQLLACYALLTALLPGIDEAWQFGHIYLSKSGLALPVPQWLDGHWQIDYPQRHRFAIAGGARLTPEFLALFLGLSLYTSAYLAEVIRAGLESVGKGQREAAAALGLSHAQTVRRVILPQALRVIIPPATNQFSSLIKSSSLAITVGYPDLVSIANTSLNQSGRAIECITLILLTYLLLSLLLSGLMGMFNRRAQRWAS